MNPNNMIRLLEIFARDYQVRRAVINQGAKTASDLTTMINNFADQWAYEIALREFAKEQRNR